MSRSLSSILFALFALVNNVLGQFNIQSLPLDYTYGATDLNQSNWHELTGLTTNHRYFFVGESHGVAANPKIHFKTFAFLYHVAGVRCYVMEANYSYAYFVNKYVQTGDTTFLDKLTPKTDHLETKKLQDEYIASYKQLYAFNQTLPPIEKITISSIDTEPFYYTSDMVSTIVSERGTPPASIADAIKRLCTFKLSNRFVMLPPAESKTVKKELQALRDNYTKNTDDYQRYFGDDLVHIDMILHNEATLNRSEKALADNFRYIDTQYKKEAYYFQYGNQHVQPDGKSLAALVAMQKNGQTISIGTQYNDCTFTFGGKAYTQQTFGVVSKSSSKVFEQYNVALAKANIGSFGFISVSDARVKLLGGYTYFFSINGQ